MLGGKVVRKNNSIDFLGTMELRKTIFLCTLLSFCLLISLGIKMLLTRGGDGAVGPEGNEHQPSVGKKMSMLIRRKKEEASPPKMFVGFRKSRTVTRSRLRWRFVWLHSGSKGEWQPVPLL